MPPQRSSSRTRSVDSCACSSAIRQLFRYLPPKSVSWKWICHESAASTLPNAAATPPSAITVCAFPSSDLETSAVREPSALDSIAARSPAPPAPITRTSYSCVSYPASDTSEDPRVVEDAVRREPHVEVRERDRRQADPRPLHVPEVED